MRKKAYKELIEPFRNYSCFREMKNRISYLTLQNYVKIQQKGGYQEVKTYKYMGFRFRTALTKDKDEVLFMIDKNNRCFVLKIDLEYPGLAILEGFGNDSKCSVPKLPKDGGGTIMMYFLLNYVKKNLPDIKKIELTDNSYVLCDNDKINLSGLYILISGMTWYGKFGFLPEGKETRVKYNNNIKIINKLTILDVWKELEDIFIYFKIRKENKLLKVVLKKIFKKDCRYYEDIWDFISNKYKIKSMYGKNFILNMDNYNPVTR